MMYEIVPKNRSGPERTHKSQRMVLKRGVDIGKRICNISESQMLDVGNTRVFMERLEKIHYSDMEKTERTCMNLKRPSLDRRKEKTIGN